MTTDERLNDQEDQIQKLKETINHNNKVTRGVNDKLSAQILELKKMVEELKTQVTAKNVGVGDIFGGGFGR
jgi:hypothetical protein